MMRSVCTLARFSGSGRQHHGQRPPCSVNTFPERVSDSRPTMQQLYGLPLTFPVVMIACTKLSSSSRPGGLRATPRGSVAGLGRGHGPFAPAVTPSPSVPWCATGTGPRSRDSEREVDMRVLRSIITAGSGVVVVGLLAATPVAAHQEGPAIAGGGHRTVTCARPVITKFVFRPHVV